MEFNLKPSKVAGSPSAILENDDVRAVFSLFGDKCLEVYQIDIRQKRAFMSATVLRQVSSFVTEYGVEDAKRIVSRLFENPRRGNHNGQPVGTSIFSKGFRWLANQLLIEKAGQDRFGTNAEWSKW